MKHEKAECPVCKGEFAVSVDGSLRKHPRGAEEPCVGTGYIVAAPAAYLAERGPAAASAYAAGARFGQAIRNGVPSEPKPPPRIVAGTYRSREPMLDSSAPIPDGYVAITLIAHVPYDGSNGRTPAEEAALLFEDPGHLYRVLDDTPNTHVRLTMKVPRGAKPVYSDTTSPASDPGATTGATP